MTAAPKLDAISITEEPFNARPDNSPSNNHIAFSKAIAFCRDHTGGSLYIPDYRFEVAQPLVIPEFVNRYSGMSFWGTSRNAEIVAAADFPDNRGLFECNAAGPSFRGFTINTLDRNISAIVYGGICNANGFSQNRVSDMSFMAGYRSTIVCDGAWNLQVMDNEFLLAGNGNRAWAVEILWCGTNSLIRGNDTTGGQGVCIRKPPDKQQNEGTIIDDNVLCAAGGDGLLIEGGLEIYVINNVIDQIKEQGIRVPCSGKGMASLKVINNWIVGPQGAFTCEGNCIDLEFSSNTVENGDPVILDGDRGGVTRPIIERNKFRHPAHWDNISLAAFWTEGARSAFNYGEGRIYIGGGSDWLSVGDMFSLDSTWGHARRLGQ